MDKGSLKKVYKTRIKIRKGLSWLLAVLAKKKDDVF